MAVGGPSLFATDLAEIITPWAFELFVRHYSGVLLSWAVLKPMAVGGPSLLTTDLAEIIIPWASISWIIWETLFVAWEWRNEVETPLMAWISGELR